MHNNAFRLSAPPEEMEPPAAGVPVAPGGGAVPVELGGGGVLPVGGGVPTKVLTEIAPAVPLSIRGTAVEEAPMTFEIPTETKLAAEGDNVTFTTPTTPSGIALTLRPAIKHVYKPGLPSHCIVLAAAIAEGPIVALTAITLLGS